MRGSAARFAYLRVLVSVSKTISQASLTPKPATAACGAPPGATDACTASLYRRRNWTSSARVKVIALPERLRHGQRVGQRPSRPEWQRLRAGIRKQNQRPGQRAQPVHDLDDQI